MIFHTLVSRLIFSSFLIRWLLFKPTIGTMTLLGGDDIDTLRASSRRGTLRFLKGSHVVSISNKLSEIYLRNKLPPENLHQIPGGVDTEKFRPASLTEKLSLRTMLGIPRETLLVLFTGAIQERKRIELAVWSLVPLMKKNPQLRLIVIGPVEPKDLAYGKKIHALVRELRITDRVQFLGQVGNVEEYMMAADAYVFTSSSEGLGYVLIEYAACGIPGVATRLQGVTDMVVQDAQTGFLVEGNDPKVYTSRIEMLLDNRELRENMGRNARAFALAHFSFDVVAAQNIELLQRLAKR